MATSSTSLPSPSSLPNLPSIVQRASFGLTVGPLAPTTNSTQQQLCDGRVRCCDLNGNLLAYTHERRVVVASLPNCQPLFELEEPNIMYVKFSPKGSLL